MPRCGVRSAQRAGLAVDIVAPEFSLALRYFSGRCRCKLWVLNEKLVTGNDFNARGNRRESGRAKPTRARERDRRDMFITSATAMRTVRAP